MLNLNLCDTNEQLDIVDIPDACSEMLDFLYEQMDELYCDKELQIVDQLFNEADEKLKAFENAIAIKEHIEKYGVSQEFLDLTGYSEEGIVQSVGNAIVSFFKWLWKWLSNICSFFYKLFTGEGSDSVSDTSSTPPTTSSSGGGSGSNRAKAVAKVQKALKNKKTWEQLKDEIEKIKISEATDVEVPDNLSTLNDEFREIYLMILNSGKLASGTTTHIGGTSKIDNKFRTSFDNISWTTISGTSEKNKAYKDTIVLVDTIFEIIYRIEPTIKVYNSLKDIKIPNNPSEEQINELSKKVNAVFGPSIRTSKSNDLNEWATRIREYVAYTNHRLRTVFRMILICRRIATRVLSQIWNDSGARIRISGTTKAPIFVFATPPKQLVAHLREIWKFKKFKLNRVVVTNMSYDFRSKDYVKGYRHNANDTTVYINPSTIHLNDKKETKDGIDATYNQYKDLAEYVKQYDPSTIKTILRTIIHETRHCLQAQLNDPSLDEKPDESIDDKFLRYLKLHAETEARKAAEEYISKYMTDADQEWVKSLIMKALLQEKKNIEKYAKTQKPNN